MPAPHPLSMSSVDAVAVSATVKSGPARSTQRHRRAWLAVCKDALFPRVTHHEPSHAIGYCYKTLRHQLTCRATSPSGRKKWVGERTKSMGPT